MIGRSIFVTTSLAILTTATGCHSSNPTGSVETVSSHDGGSASQSSKSIVTQASSDDALREFVFRLGMSDEELRGKADFSKCKRNTSDPSVSDAEVEYLCSMPEKHISNMLVVEFKGRIYQLIAFFWPDRAPYSVEMDSVFLAIRAKLGQGSQEYKYHVNLNAFGLPQSTTDRACAGEDCSMYVWRGTTTYAELTAVPLLDDATLRMDKRRPVRLYLVDLPLEAEAKRHDSTQKAATELNQGKEAAKALGY